VCSRSCRTCPTWAWTRCGSRRSIHPRTPTSATTSPTTAPSTRGSGRLADLERLLAAAHERELRVLLDLVVNHTSDRHPWFRERRDFYIWRSEPNNWRSLAGGSAWQHDSESGEYYLHSFLPEQPDLDWRNPEVREAIGDVMRFWLDRGVDGFRLDALPAFVKDAQFRDDPPDRRVHMVDQPEMAEVIAFLRAVTDEYEDRILVAEMGLPPARAARYHAAIHIPFNFGLITEPWTAPRVARRIAAHLEALPDGASPNWVLGNHDVRRPAGRLGPERARVAAVIALTLPGTLTLYYGDELGVPDGPPPPAPRDRFARSRDPARAPMPWDGSVHGGFSEAEPWLPAYPDAGEIGVAAQRADPSSPLALYRRLLELRRHNGWALGGVESLAATDHELVYDRPVHRILARVDPGPALFSLPSPGRVVLTARRPHAARPDVLEQVALDGPDAAVVELL
jgi:alpha-glucosidase